jgi:hypothetical protein
MGSYPAHEGSYLRLILPNSVLFCGWAGLVKRDPCPAVVIAWCSTLLSVVDPKAPPVSIRTEAGTLIDVLAIVVGRNMKLSPFLGLARCRAINQPPLDLSIPSCSRSGRHSLPNPPEFAAVHPDPVQDGSSSCRATNLQSNIS